MPNNKYKPPSRRSHISRLRSELTSIQNTSLTKPKNVVDGEMWLEAAAGTAYLKAQINGAEVTLVVKAL